MTTQEGLQEIARRGLVPDLVYVDANHTYEAVLTDIRMARELFPRALLVGDDYNWQSVRRAVDVAAKELRGIVQANESAWSLTPSGE